MRRAPRAAKLDLEFPPAGCDPPPVNSPAEEAAGRPRREAEDPGEPASALVQGSVERVLYHDESSLYTVLKVYPEKGYGDPEAFLRLPLTAVGTTPRPADGMRVRLHGGWTQHRTHGRQFEFEHLEPLAPGDVEGLVKYLSSSAFEGVGPKLAQRIVDELGTEALTIIQEKPEALEAVAGLRAPVRERLVDRVRQEFGSHELFVFLRGVGLGAWQAREIASVLGPDAERRIRADPYVVATGIAGIGFLTADRIARKLGLAEDAPERLAAALVHALTAALGEGHSLLPLPRLLASVRELLRLSLIHI